MSTLENLFVQVFERKRWIVDLVKQQSDLFDQSLASNSLINGFQPPSWLLSSRFELGSADLKELKKEDLISSFLFPPPRTNNYSSSAAAHNRFRYKPLLSEGNVQDVLGKNDFDVKGSSMLAPEASFDNKVLYKSLFSESNVQDVLEKNCFKVGDSSMLVPEGSWDEGTTSGPRGTEARLSDVKSQLDKSQARSREKVVSRLCLENDGFLDARDSLRRVSVSCTSEAISSPPQTETGCCDTGLQMDKSQSRSRKRVVSRLCLEKDEFLEVRDSSGLVPMSHTNEAISSPPQIETGCCETGSQPDKSHSRSQKKVVSRLCLENDEFPEARDSLGLLPMSHTSETISSPPQTETERCDTGPQLDKSKSRSRKMVGGGLCLENDEFLHARDSSGVIPLSHTNEAICSPPQTETVCCETGFQLHKSKSRSHKKVVSGLCLENDEFLDAMDSSGPVPMCHTSEALSSPPLTEKGCCEAASKLEESQAIMQRSRSRQMALELRKSKSADVKPGKRSMQIYDSDFTGRITRSAASVGLSADARGLLEQLNISINKAETSCGVTQHGSDVFHVNSSNKPLQPPNFVDGEDMLQNIPGSEDLCRSLKSAKEVLGANREEHPSKVDITEVRASSDAHKKPRLGFIGSEKYDPDFYHTRSVGPSNLSVRPLRRRPSEIDVDSSLRIQQQGVVDQNALCFGMELKIGSSEEMCKQNLDLVPYQLRETFMQDLHVAANEVLGGSYKYVTVPDEHEKSRTPDVSCEAHYSLHQEHVLPLSGQENKCVGEADTCNRRVLMQTTTPESAQFSFRIQGTPYLPTSSSKHVEKDGFPILDDHICESKFINSKLNAAEKSWPQYKRRKIEDRSSNVFRTHPRSVRLEQLHQISETSIPDYCRTAQNGLKSDMKQKHVSSFSGLKVYHSHGIEGYGERISENAKHRKTDSYGLSPRLQAEEGDIDMEDTEKDTNISMEFKKTWVDPSLDFSVDEEEHENAHDCPPGTVDISVSMLTTEEQNFVFDGSELNSEIMAKALAMGENVQDTESVIGDWLLSYSSVRSLNFGDLDTISPKSIPELEGFHIDLAAENILSHPGDEIILGNIDLPSGGNERMGVLEKLCGYSTMITPLKESSKHKNRRDVHQSPSIDLQENMDLESTVPFSDQNFKQLEGSYKITREPGFMPPSLAELDWNAGKPPCTPPVKMLGQKIISLPAHHSFEKHKMGNPELTCFRIDEDTCTSEENGTLDEVDDVVHECDDSRYSNSSSHRKPLVDMTNTETQKSNSVPKDVHERDSIASVNREPYMLRTQTDANLKLRNTYGNDKKLKSNKENHSSTVGVNGVEKSSKTHFSMEPRLLRKTSEQNRLPSFLGKGSKRANIVSNVSSFIPLVQRKQQTTAFATGKRDVKIKALEAAEAAKRLEEKRDRDRKIKKEAAKLKRAQLEEEKVKQLELKQRKEAEEQKKKEANMGTKKRLREEQDRKERERKRRCVEEARKEQPKLRAEKEEIEQRRRAADVRLDKKKHLRNEESRHQKPEKRSQIADDRVDIITGARSAQEASETAKNVSEAHEDPAGLNEYDDKMKRTVRSSKSKVKKTSSNLCDADAKNCLFTLSEGNGEPSYDISPYQASDDEDEEERVIPKKKYIPSWAREKSLVSIMPFLERVDPYEIFPSTRVCNISQFFHK